MPLPAPRRLPSLLLACALSACHRPPAPVASAASAPLAAPAASAASAIEEAAASAPPPVGALGDSKEELMHEAFDDWHPDQPYVADLPSDDPKDPAPRSAVVTPAFAVAVDEDHRVLVVTGTLSDEDGAAVDSHASAGSVSTYAFERRGGRWFRSAAAAFIEWTGSYGNASDVKEVDLGAGHHGLVIEGGYCGQGYCGSQLELFGVTRDRTLKMASLMTSSDSTGALEGCSERLAGTPASAPAEPGGPDPTGCFAIQGSWHAVPVAGAEWSDFVVTFKGDEVVVDNATKAAAVRHIDEALVLRHAGDKYLPVKGRNPTHAI